MTQYSDIDKELSKPLEALLLSVADDKLVLGHRNSDWTGLGPTLEEDIAFSALAQDSIAHASVLYELIAKLRGEDDADRIAFDRGAEAFRCAQLLELPDDFDYATALARAFYFTHFDILRVSRMAKSSWKPLADLASRIAAEEQVHIDHIDDWIVRLGGAGGDAAKRLQDALNELAPHAAMLLEQTDGQNALVEAGLYPAGSQDLDAQWRDAVTTVTQRAGLTLTMPSMNTNQHGGRRGGHSEHLAPLVDEMTAVYRLEPGAAW